MTSVWWVSGRGTCLACAGSSSATTQAPPVPFGAPRKPRPATPHTGSVAASPRPAPPARLLPLSGLRHARPGPIGLPPSVSDPACGWDALLTMADDHLLLPALWSRLIARGVQPLPAPLRRPDSAL